MNERICLFAGTSEGRLLAELLEGAADVTVCVATGYGETALDGIGGINVRRGRMDREEMEEFFSGEDFSLVIDATHPYAGIVTENIASAAKKADVPVMRVLRGTGERVADAVYVPSVKEARDFLAGKEGSILITTGAKELEGYSGLDMSRVWARVLPLASSLEACEKTGIEASHVIAAQGPFTYEMNLAQLKMINAAYLVTKSSGKNGGFEEKINAARAAGAAPVIIGEPPRESGLTIDEAISELAKVCRIKKRKLCVVGIGPGNKRFLTAEAKAALDECDAVIGAESVVGALGTDKPAYYEYLPEKVLEVLSSRPSIRRAAVVMRGDAGFFSGAKRLLDLFDGEDVTVIPGVSSVALLASRLGKSWEDAAFVSLHGRKGNIVRSVCRSRKTFVLTDAVNTPSETAARLCEYGMGDLFAAVGEKLSYPDERITNGRLSELAEMSFDRLAVMYIENEEPENGLRFGIPDVEFIRGDIPMTKAEVRAVSLSRLAPRCDSVVWDVGAGTGSVSVECALAAYNGQVFAVEKKRDACELIRKNAVKFRTDNVTVVEGSAPDALGALPAPTHVFIGGSSGNMREIISCALKKNPDARIVANAVTLETQAELTLCAGIFGFGELEAVSVNISRSLSVGKYHLMNAHSPVWVYYMHGARL